MKLLKYTKLAFLHKISLVTYGRCTNVSIIYNRQSRRAYLTYRTGFRKGKNAGRSERIQKRDKPLATRTGNLSYEQEQG